MFDTSYCSVMKLGPPEISIDGLNELVAFLATLRKTRRKTHRPALRKGGERRCASEKAKYKTSFRWRYM
jgi:hypothetical protein